MRNADQFQSFTTAMASSLPTSSDYELDFFTAPTSVSPLSIEGSFDSLISATACLSQLKGQLPRWDGVSQSCLLLDVPGSLAA